MISPYVPPVLRDALVRAAKISWRISRNAPRLLGELAVADACHEHVATWIRGDTTEERAARSVHVLAILAEKALDAELARAGRRDGHLGLAA